MALSFKIKLYSSLFITLALHIWGPTMANGCVLFFTDNAALVDIINKRTSKTLTLHDSFYVTLYSAAKYWGGGGGYHIFSSQPRPRLKEESCISRLQMEGFKELSPEEDNFLTAVPKNLQPESWSLT